MGFQPLGQINPGGDLLSHGEAPHYHRRCTVSLLSSVWDQVVPVLFGRQEKRRHIGIQPMACYSV
jgi:hypothetical protein